MISLCYLSDFNIGIIIVGLATDILGLNTDKYRYPKFIFFYIDYDIINEDLACPVKRGKSMADIYF
jgi:uncharacterized membrane protein